jgi:hypothetical protein
MKKILVVLMALLVLFSVTGCKKQDAFVLGLDDSFPPMGFRNDANEIVGYDIDLAAEACKRLNLELVCQPIDWAAKEQELATGSIDCIWNGFTITPERLEAMAFSKDHLLLWVTKEAFAKYTGKGMALGRNELTLPYFEDELMLSGVYFKRIDICGYTAVICTESHDNVEIVEVP